MDPRTLEQLDSFALLAPGYSLAGRALLVTRLREDPSGPLVFQPFEGRSPFRYRGDVHELPAFPRMEAWALPTVELDPEDYARSVERIRESIASGDAYQVCYTLRARVSGVAGSDLLAALSARELPRFGAWVRLPGGTEFVSGSPELLLEVEGTRARSEPMKGTARAGAAGDLEASEKDRAELAMITDLVRNDLTRVCVPRSVRVACERRFVQLAYAVQTVSDVEGMLPRSGEWEPALAALHPAGSVVGAPKSAALRMICELEGDGRGAYCGVLGWAPGRGGAVFALLIRTAQKRSGEWEYGVGGGIVYDSTPERELDELRVKLEALTGEAP